MIDVVNGDHGSQESEAVGSFAKVLQTVKCVVEQLLDLVPAPLVRIPCLMPQILPHRLLASAETRGQGELLAPLAGAPGLRFATLALAALAVLTICAADQPQATPPQARSRCSRPGRCAAVLVG